MATSWSSIISKDCIVTVGLLEIVERPFVCSWPTGAGVGDEEGASEVGGNDIGGAAKDGVVRCGQGDMVRPGGDVWVLGEED